MSWVLLLWKLIQVIQRRQGDNLTEALYFFEISGRGGADSIVRNWLRNKRKARVHASTELLYKHKWQNLSNGNKLIIGLFGYLHLCGLTDVHV